MMAIGSESQKVGGRAVAVRAERDLASAYPTIEPRWGELLSAGRELVGVILSHPLLLARAEARLALELTRIVLGRSDLAPVPGDRRFAESAWQGNPAFRRVLQGYLAWSQVLLELIHGLRIKPEQKRRLLFAAHHLVAAGAPSNLCLTHPGFYQRARATRGRSVVAGLRHLLDDLRDNHGLPRQVNAAAFHIGRNIATTPGAVIFRNDICELIQYAALRERVDSRAVLFCPPQINKYYIVDLSPEKSLVRYALEAGQQVFALSWRNPTAAQHDWGLARYVAAVSEAIDILGRLTGEPVKLMGACAGGLTATVALARLAAQQQQDKVACLTLLVTLLESPRPGRSDQIVGDAAIATALARSKRRGVLDGADMARAFAWLRPDDLVWRFVTNNYVLGCEPPASDVLYWNSDTTRLPARLHADLLRTYRDNPLRRPGGLVIDGVPIDMSQIDRDVFVVAGAQDHITPWQSCYRSMQMFHSNVRFVLGAAGHVQSIICPPGSEHAQFLFNDDYTRDPAAWRRGARPQHESWWPAWIRWCEAHGGEQRAAPTVYGDEDFEPIEAAPGRYVRQT